MKKLFWIVGEWITKLPCRFDYHDFGPWRENTFNGRVLWDWHRNCQRCDHCEQLQIGENPPGLTHSSPRKFSYFSKINNVRK